MEKLAMFGKSFNIIGNHNANTCLSTLGDIVIKTPNRFVTIFKNGKLAVDNSSEIFIVSSEEAMKKTGIYIIKSVDDTKPQAIYLYIDGTKILLSSNSSEYISYTTTQELKPEHFIQAMKNLGVYFQTLEDAKTAKLTEGLVYILETQKLYKIVNSEFVEITNSVIETQLKNNTSTKPENINSLQIGGIFIDGSSNVINTGDSLSIQIDGIDYVWFKNNQVFTKRDLIIGRQNMLMLEGSEPGGSGFIVYTKNDEAYLEVDNLIIHNSSSEYEPQIHTTYIGTSNKNQIQNASWYSAPTDISLILKYKNKFNPGDYVLIQTAGGNRVSVTVKKLTVATDDGQEKIVQRIQAILESAPLQDVNLEVTYNYSVNETGMTGVVNIMIPTTIIEEGKPIPNTYGESAIIEDIPTIEEIVSVKILSGDADIFYGNMGGTFLPVSHIGTVSSVNPLIISLPTQENLANSILANLKNSPIYKIGSPSEIVNVLFHSNNSISLQECTVKSGTLTRKITTQIGDLSVVEKPQSNSSTIPIEFLSGTGIYSDTFVGVEPKFYGGVFEGIEGAEYPVYGELLNFPEESFNDSQYDKVIPCVGWVKKLIEQAIKKNPNNSGT